MSEKIIKKEKTVFMFTVKIYISTMLPTNAFLVFRLFWCLFRRELSPVKMLLHDGGIAMGGR